MKSQSMLAAVHAAANDTAFGGIAEKPAAAAAPSQTQETTMADTSAAAPQPKIENVEQLTAAFPDLVGKLTTDAKTSGATAERGRIEQILAVPGARNHASLVSQSITDGKTTGAEFALAMVNAEKGTREKAAADLAAAETTTAAVKATATATGAETKVETKATTPEQWKAEWEGSDKLQAEFPTVESYVATKRREPAAVS